MSFKHCFCVLVGMYCTAACAGVGAIDEREYVDWHESPYNQIVYFYNDGTCTAQYVARDIILTARHCITAKPDFDNYAELGKKFKIKLHDGRKTEVTLEKYGRDFINSDWAILRVIDPAFYSNSPFAVSTQNKKLTVTNAGFGYMRILNDSELKTIKEIFLETAKRTGQSKYNFVDLIGPSSTELEKHGIASLHDFDTTAVRDCYTNADGQKYCYFDYKLKAHKGCRMQQVDTRGKNIVNSCDSMQGNSGGPFFANNTLYGIVSRGHDTYVDERIGATTAVAPKQIWQALKDTPVAEQPKPETKPESETAAQQGMSQSSAQGEPYETSENSSRAEASNATSDTAATVQPSDTLDNILPSTPDIPKTMESDQVQEELANREADLNTRAENIANISDKEFLNFLSDAVDYTVLQDRYNKAKERENSFANRMLGAAGIASVGIGLQKTLSGMAEQRADAHAEEDMRQYLSTFTCNYGGGKQHKLGDTNIEVPLNGNMFGLYQEYTLLADNLKKTKNSLGLKPGIESEVVIDKASSGLYDDVAVGKTGGGYPSIARAILNPDGDDAKQWQKQIDAAAQKTKTGAITAGAGAIGTAVGNMIINRDMYTTGGQDTVQ